MKMHDLNNIVLIPSLEPDTRLTAYIDNLNSLGLTKIIVVDDGSGESYQPIFDELAAKGCVVLHHEKNCGKGRALKTGFQYIQENFMTSEDSFSCVITADADGQHAPEDVCRVAKLSKQHGDALILGTRDFTTPGVPQKSLLGNRITSALFAALYGSYISDTQTGLRAFGPRLLPLMIQIPGERFEYELQMLITCVRSQIPLQTQPIRVIYENANKGTHFKAIADSARVMRVLFSSFLRFSLSSFAGAMVDMGGAWLLLDILRPFIPENYLRIFLATTLARVVSIGVNYLLNRRFVFNERTGGKGSLSRYLLLCIVNIIVSSSGVYILNTQAGINEKIGKIICDTVLFILNYRIQQQWVFVQRKG